MTRRRAAVLSCLLGLVTSALVACEPSDPTPVGRGRGLFQRTCSGCHGRDGRGAMRPGLSRPPRDLTNPAFQAKMTDEQLRQSIRIGKGQMPAFGGLLGEEEIRNLIAYIRSLAPPGTAVPGAAGSGPGAVSPGAAGSGGAAGSAAGAAAPGSTPPAGTAAPGSTGSGPGAAHAPAPGAAGGASGTAPASLSEQGGVRP